MGMLLFMPWCPIDKRYSFGNFYIIPFDRDQKPEDLDDLTHCHLRSFLSPYKDLEGHPVNNAALIKYNDKTVTDDLSDEELSDTREVLELFCFSGLAVRQYFAHGPYCNKDNFIFVVQKFKDDSSWVGLVSRRREGHTTDGRDIDRLVFSIPVHASYAGPINIDEDLYSALIDYRSSSPDDVWARWQNAISCFNQANTDNYVVNYQVEWVLLSSAIEHLIGANSNAMDVAQKLHDIIVPNAQLSVSGAKRRSDKWTDPNQSLRFEWMREFYRVRGDFAHGKLKTGQPLTWNPLEHIVLASIAFPLIVKVLLKQAGKYTLSQDDMAQIEAFESLANEDFLNPPPNPKSSNDTWWVRLTLKAKYRLAP